ncbi:MAG: amidohydrolase [Chloroflexi bacterium]|nr:amidohydrolase [Chloroflexota bacterium]
MSDAVTDQVAEALPGLIELRRDLHQNPELGFYETRTAGIISGRLNAAGLKVRAEVGGTGVVGVLETGRAGPTLMIRADMDALPVEELSGLPFASSNGQMHACGHDGHITMALGAAELLARRTDDLSGTLVFVFQPAEEFVEGAKAMIADNVMADHAPDRVIGLHLWNQYETGFVGVNQGTVFASADQFELVITGKGGHGALPHTAIDPVVITAQVISALQTVVSREIPPNAMGVLTVGQVIGGTAPNVIADFVTVRGTIRAYTSEIRDQIIAAAKRTASGVAETMRGSAEFRLLNGAPPVVNDPEVAAWLTGIAGSVPGVERVGAHEEVPVGDDMAEFINRVPGCYFLLGAGDPERPPHHNARFVFDEGCLPLGVEIFARAALDYLAK